MTRKHFESIATVIHHNHDLFKSNTAHAEFAREMSYLLAYENARFDRVKFVLACMPTHLVGTAKGEIPWDKAAGLR